MLKPGLQHMNSNYKELMTNIESEGRRKAIETLMKKYGISEQEAMHKQSLRIIQRLAKKK